MLRSSLTMRLTLSCLLVASARTESKADSFVLTSGATVRGQWLNREESASAVYVINTEHGGRVQLERSQVVKVVRESEAQDKYARFAPYAADTVEDHWKVAKWCYDNDLQAQREQHLLRIIELDAHHVPARRALGYSEIGGQWVKQDEHLTRKGYVRYKGRWRLAQDIALYEQRKSLEMAKKDWYVKLSRWRSQLGGEKRHEALRSIQQVRDPLAIEALQKLVRIERDRRMRLVYVEVLGQIPSHQASAVLIDFALSDRDEEVYYACVEQLTARKTPPLVRQFVLALRSPNNARVNRAAIALGTFGDRTAVPPLIDALVTKHETLSPGNDMVSTTMVRGEGAAQNGDVFTTGPSSPQVVTVAAMNQEVLKTLVKLTGVSFSFDQQAWQNWYSVQQRRASPTSTGARRGG